MLELQSEPKAFQDIETGVIYEIYPFTDGKTVVFNLDGAPFKFDSFLLITSRIEEEIQSVFIHIPRLAVENIIKIGEMVELTMDKYDMEELGEELAVRLEMKPEAIEKFINPKFPLVRNLKQFLMIRDDIGGSVVLDFYYYNFFSIEPPYIEVIEEDEDDY